MSIASQTDTTVGIVGGGPAGLMLSHLLDRAGIANVVIDNRTRDEIEHTVRAGILEVDSVNMLLDNDVSDRVLRDGYRHDGIDLRFDGESHRIDFEKLVGEAVWLYPQTDVFIDLADARERDGADVRFGITDTEVFDVTGDRPRIEYTDAEGLRHEIVCDYLVGSDGSRSICRHQMPESQRRHYFKEYPFAWFGFLVDAPPSAPELIYAHSDRGFALVSQRTDILQRMYFQCDPEEDVANWSDERIWEEMEARVAGPDGLTLKEGAISDQAVLRFRSFVCEPMRYGSMVLAGDAAHTVPPTGAKGLNLAMSDVKILADVLQRSIAAGDKDILDEYGPRALERIWRAQQFSYWMTTMLHTLPGADDYDNRRQIAELKSVVSSVPGQTYLAEAYTGWPGRD